MGSLRRWWQSLWGDPVGAALRRGRRASRTPSARSRAPAPAGPTTRAAAIPPRRRYTAPPVTDDPQREAHLGAVLQALAGGPLGRAELGRRVDAAGWGPGRLDAVVDHGVATRVLVETDDGAVRARYAD